MAPSGLVKFGLRWYDPTTGRSTQQDTLDAPLDPVNANRMAAVFSGVSFLDAVSGRGLGFVVDGLVEAATSPL